MEERQGNDHKKIYILCIICVIFVVIMSVLPLLLFVVVKPISIYHNAKVYVKDFHIMKQPRTNGGTRNSTARDARPQATPVIANKVEGVWHHFSSHLRI